jgi:hypothetical protein
MQPEDHLIALRGLCATPGLDRRTWTEAEIAAWIDLLAEEAELRAEVIAKLFDPPGELRSRPSGEQDR